MLFRKDMTPQYEARGKTYNCELNRLVHWFNFALCLLVGESTKRQIGQAESLT